MSKKSRVVGGSKLRRQLRRFEPETRTELAMEIAAIGKEFADEVTARAPKDKGDLANAAHYVISSDKMGVSIGYSKNKSGFKMKWKRGGFTALFQEYGTSKHAAQPFIRPAWHAKLEGALDRIDAARRKVIQRITRL